MKIRIDIQVERWSIDQLIPRVTDPRTHTPEQVAQVAASMREFGWTNPILVGADNDVLAGHARLLAARQLGMTEVPVIQLGHLSEAQRRALVIADNQLAISGASWDEETLRLELAALQEGNFDLSLVGFDDEELARLLAAEEATEGLTDEDAVPDVPEAPISVAADLWRLGPHVLLAGDATNEADVARLMDGATADLVFTDPPYNVDHEGYTEDRLTIQGDRMTDEQFREFLATTFASYRRIVKPGASLYVCHPSSWQREFQNALEAAGFEVRCQIIWAKNTFAWGFGRYKFRHEPIFYAHVVGQSDSWYGDKSQSTLWEENKPVANRLHPTMKPVGLIERALLNSSKAGDLVVDLFGGSGSTLIACERRGRVARLMELDPRYADAICRRYQEYTDKQAALEGDGRTFEEIAEERRKGAA
jgi:DNA modification methylase